MLRDVCTKLTWNQREAGSGTPLEEVKITMTNETEPDEEE